MIERRQIYVAKCDGLGCGVYFSEEGTTITKRGHSYSSCWVVKRYEELPLIYYLDAAGWKRKGKKWFCPNCQEKK